MIFEEILPILREGRSVKRSSHRHVQLIRLVNPKVEPAVDGPERVWVLEGHAGLVKPTKHYESEKEAQEALKALRSEHKTVWDNHLKKVAAWEATEDRTTLDPSSAPYRPRLAKDYYEGIKITELPAPRRNRINKPFLTVLLKNGTVEPYILTHEDLFASDWGVA